MPGGSALATGHHRPHTDSRGIVPRFLPHLKAEVFTLQEF
jgi:hypothetical protein